MSEFAAGTPVRHAVHGRGQVMMAQPPMVVVRFEHGIEACLQADLEALVGLAARIHAGKTDLPLPVLLRSLALAITSVNETWGVFSRSKIALLPHQLWVCRKVLAEWPTRWLVADDVGLGKTVEAGLILTPLISNARVKRLLILSPASLVEQWSERLHEMFGLNIQVYSPESDRPRLKYWDSVNMVVASAHTMRLDRRGRWDRLFEAAPWDMVMVDEAHHLNASERGATLAYRLVRQLAERRLVRSMVFFTGTPHRGVDHAFLALLNLLRPDDFNPDEDIREQLPRLKSVMIRNNKQRVTDMKGDRLFTPVRPHFETYDYSSAEQDFYRKMTEFIVSGRAYASTLARTQGQAVELVLIYLQKLASSSVAAARRALAGRRIRLIERKARADGVLAELRALQEAEGMDPAGQDRLSELQERLSEDFDPGLALIPHELQALDELLALADAVTTETKIERIIEVVDERFTGESILFFTEYKATQSLLLGAIERHFGAGCATFINGDGRVIDVRGRGPATRTEARQAAALRFRTGTVRFLVSTEAAGEGIDLQDNCSTLIHVDLPWNPMRLHQRVGRISRYGQKLPVDVLTFRNPNTIESHIWQLLDEKLLRITRAFQSAMDDPEDMRQLVIGMASPSLFEDIFSEGANVPEERLEEWFDAKAATLGDQDVVAAVREIFGNVARFDFGEIAPLLPRVDLPDLEPFFKGALTFFQKRFEERADGSLAFRTPRMWQDHDMAVAERYDALHFSRDQTAARDQDVAGVGHRVVNAAVASSERLDGSLTAVQGLAAPLALYLVRDGVTDQAGNVRRVLAGVERTTEGDQVLMDWQILKRLNGLLERPRSPVLQESGPLPPEGPSSFLSAGRDALAHDLDRLRLPFRLPVVEDAALFWPVSADSK